MDMKKLLPECRHRWVFDDGKIVCRRCGSNRAYICVACARSWSTIKEAGLCCGVPATEED